MIEFVAASDARWLIFALTCLMALSATITILSYQWAASFAPKSPVAVGFLGLALLEVGVQGVLTMALVGSSGWLV